MLTYDKFAEERGWHPRIVDQLTPMSCSGSRSSRPPGGCSEQLAAIEAAQNKD